MGKLMYIPVDMIYPNPRNPRKNFDPEAMAELVASVRQVGILQPVVVVRDEDENLTRYRLVAGERRYRAAKEAGVTELPAVIKELTPEQELEVMIIENLQREGVDPIEEAQGMRALLDEGGYTQEALAVKLGCSQGHIANRLRLLELPESVQQNISRGIIGPGHAKELLSCKKTDQSIIERVAKKAADEGLTVKAVASEIKREIWSGSKPLETEGWYDAPKFDLSGCEKCKNKASIKPYDGAEEYPRCLNAKCWDKKQHEAECLITNEKEAELRQKYPDALILDNLPKESYEYIPRWDTEFVDSYCTEKGCENFKEGRSRGSDVVYYICLNREMFKECHSQHEQAKDKTQEDKRTGEREELKQLVASNIGPGGGGDLVMINRKKLIFLTGLILECCETYGYSTIAIFEYLEKVAGNKFSEVNEEDLLEEGLLDEGWPQLQKLLDGLTTEQLIQITLEWPALTLGMNCPIVEWFFKSEQKPGIAAVDEDDESGTDPVHALMGRTIQTHYNTGGVVTGVSGPKDDGFYTVNYRDPRDKGKRLSTINSITFSEGMVLCEGVPLTILDADREHKELPVRSFLDNDDKEIFVSTGLGGDTFGSFRRSPTGGLHRVKSPAMPMVATREEAQANLDAWAKKKGLQPVEHEQCSQSA